MSTVQTIRHLVLGVALAALLGCTTPRSSENPNRPLTLAGHWQDALERGLDGATGFALVVHRAGQPLLAQGYGLARRSGRANDPPMTPDTRMHVASCSKPLTAVALLQLLEREGLAADSSVGDVLGARFDIEDSVAVVTLRQLLAHTSGFPFDYVWSPRLENTAELLARPLPGRPGERRVYSNINYSLARTALEALAERSYEDYARDELLAPAGVESMALSAAPDEVAWAHRLGEPEGAALALDFEDEAGPYGWYATANELACVLDGVLDGSILSDGSRQQMLDEGLGWNRVRTHGGPGWRHDGKWVIEGNRGVQAAVALFPDDVVAVLFVNTNGSYAPGDLLTRTYEASLPRVRAMVDRSSNAVIRAERPSHVEELRWSDDGSVPGLDARRYEGPFHVQAPATLRFRGFSHGKPATFVRTLEIQERH